MVKDHSKTHQTWVLKPELFMLLSVLVGAVTGFGAVAFRALIALFHNLFFYGQFSLYYDANTHAAPSSWGPWVILVPVAGAVLVSFLVKNFAPEAKGHGVPEVIDAIYYHKGRIRPVVAFVKSIASAISIGSGGSVGREGPIIQIGSSFGSTIGQFLRLSPWQCAALIAGGASAGIAATFNTPIGGVIFAEEILMQEISARTLVPVAISTVTATYIGRLFFGTHPSFVIPPFDLPPSHGASPFMFLSFVGLGGIIALVSLLFIKSIYGFEDFFDKHLDGGYYRKHLIGMFLVGCLMYVLMVTFGHYYVQGVGYATVQGILSKNSFPLYLLGLLFVMKLIATSLTLGSGASGGVFSPSLFLGATFGGAYGLVANWLIPHLGVHPAVFAMAGMAGMVSGVAGAPITAVVMIFEMTLHYNVIVPVTVVVAISYGLRRMLSPESIYTMKLTRRGHYIPTVLITSPHYTMRANQIMSSDFVTMSASSSLGDFAELIAERPDVLFCIVESARKIVGFLSSEIVQKPREEIALSAKLGDIAATDYVMLDQHDSLPDILAKMNYRKASIAFVANRWGLAKINRIKGLVTRRKVAAACAEAAGIGVNITEDDLIGSYKVSDMMEKEQPAISENMSLREILDTFCNSDAVFYPTVSNEGKLVGTISIACIKESLSNQETADWMLAHDVMDPVMTKTNIHTPLAEVLQYMRGHNIEYLCVTDDEDKFVGVISYSDISRKISIDATNRRRQADTDTAAATL